MKNNNTNKRVIVNPDYGNNKECETCRLDYCPDECYDAHPCSYIALQKFLREIRDTHKALAE